VIKAFIDLVEANKKPNMVTLEIGCWVGETTKGYLSTVQAMEGKSIIVDWFSGNEDITNSPTHIHRWRPNEADSIYNEFVSNIGGLKDWIRVIRGDSKVVYTEIEDNSIDICFIDGCHLYPNVKKDIELYLPKVKSGGILSGHDMEDINMAGTFGDEVNLHYISRDGKGYHPGVIQAVFDFFGKNIETIDDNDGDRIPIWVYRKL
jgi:hypothetical protein